MVHLARSILVLLPDGPVLNRSSDVRYGSPKPVSSANLFLNMVGLTQGRGSARSGYGGVGSSDHMVDRIGGMCGTVTV